MDSAKNGSTKGNNVVVSEFKFKESEQTNIFSGETQLNDQEDVLKDDDIRKITRLQLINASARFELLSANQQLIDFHLNRVMNTMKNKKKAREEQGVNKNSGQNSHRRLNNLLNIEKSVIDEVSETEENNTTQNKIAGQGSRFGMKNRNLMDPYTDLTAEKDKEKNHDRNRDSMFGTMQLTSNISKENAARMVQMKDPHQVM